MTGAARRVAAKLLCDRLDRGEALTIDALAEVFGPEVWQLVGRWFVETVKSVNEEGLSAPLARAAAGDSGDGRAEGQGS